MKRYIYRTTLILIAIPALYLIIAIITSYLYIGTKPLANDATIYLNTNGIHLDIIIPSNHLDSTIRRQIKTIEEHQYYSFGWGDENFYLNTPTWNDLTFSTAVNAMFLQSNSLMHITRHHNSKSDWIKLNINANQLHQVNKYLLGSFQQNDQKHFTVLPNKGYGSNDDFYKANGNYSCFKTCNSWVNNGLKEAGLKSCLWTPFDFTVLGIYQ